ncbi:MAG: hypothetical protein J0H73_11765 [Salana multivorans]|uniref:hypothetical protein n=1 Tax=Salana multivorans TaxID=120377 RepID=UPI00095FE31A|nr:hypothetical protein [Salana multivorans]MBN8882976.1 hypothetical protein [Salana multivorans]OJX94070.1 MAG: hypothetical protein BGO96_09695 [Micrococcales bacterium 73-15]
MRILTVRQPWAWAIVHGGKDIENSVRSLGPYRGPVAIHVAGKYATEGLDLPALDDAADAWCAIHGCADHPWFKHVGHIIGVVDLVDVHHATSCPTHGESAPWPLCSPWAERDTWHLVLEAPRPLANPIPYRGALGLRTLPDDVVARIHEQIGGAS